MCTCNAWSAIFYFIWNYTNFTEQRIVSLLRFCKINTAYTESIENPRQNYITKKLGDRGWIQSIYHILKEVSMCRGIEAVNATFLLFFFWYIYSYLHIMYIFWPSISLSNSIYCYETLKAFFAIEIDTNIKLSEMKLFFS